MSLKLLQNQSKFRKLMLAHEGLKGNRFKQVAENIDTKVAVSPEKKGIGGFFRDMGDSFKNAYNKVFKKERPTSIDTAKAPRVSEAQRAQSKENVRNTAKQPGKFGGIFKNVVNFFQSNWKNGVAVGAGAVAGGVFGIPLIITSIGTGLGGALVGAGLGGAIAYNSQRTRDNHQMTTAGAVVGGVAAGAVSLFTGNFVGTAIAGAAIGAAALPFIYDARDAIRGIGDKTEESPRNNPSNTNNGNRNLNRNSQQEPTPQEMLDPDGEFMNDAKEFSKSEVKLEVDGKQALIPQGWVQISQNGKGVFNADSNEFQSKLTKALQDLEVSDEDIQKVIKNPSNLYTGEFKKTGDVEVVTFKLDEDKLIEFFGTENIKVLQTTENDQDQDPTKATVDVAATEVKDDENPQAQTNIDGAKPSPKTEVATTKEMIAQPLTTVYAFSDVKKKFTLNGKEVTIYTASRAELQDDRFANALSAKLGPEKYKDYWNNVGQLKTIFNAYFESLNQESSGNAEQATLIKKLSTNLLNGYFANKGGQQSAEYKEIRKAIDTGTRAEVEAALNNYHLKINTDFKYDEITAEIKTEFEAANQVQPAQNEQQVTVPEQTTESSFALPKLDLTNNESKMAFAFESNKILFNGLSQSDETFQALMRSTFEKIKAEVKAGELALNSDDEYSIQTSDLHSHLVGFTTVSNVGLIKDKIKENPDKINDLFQILNQVTFTCLNKETALTQDTFANNMSDVIETSYTDQIKDNVFNTKLFKSQLSAYKVPEKDIQKVLDLLESDLKPMANKLNAQLSQPNANENDLKNEYKQSVNPIKQKIFAIIYRDPSKVQEEDQTASQA